MATDDDEKAGRSPRYPAFDLEEAIKKAKSIYDADKTAGTPMEAAYRHMGYKGKSGPASTALAALKRFGLISASGGRVTPTQRAISIIILPESDARRKKSLKEAALSPAVYQRFYDQYKEKGLPSDESFEHELLLGNEFHHSAVKSFVKDFRSSLKYAGLIGEGGVLLPAAGESSGGGGSGDDPEQEDDRNKKERKRREMATGFKEDVFSLDQGVISVQWPERIVGADSSDIEDWLKLVEKKIKRAVDAGEPADDSDDDPG